MFLGNRDRARNLVVPGVALRAVQKQHLRGLEITNLGRANQKCPKNGAQQTNQVPHVKVRQALQRLVRVRVRSLEMKNGILPKHLDVQNAHL